MSFESYQAKKLQATSQEEHNKLIIDFFAYMETETVTDSDITHLLTQLSTIELQTKFMDRVLSRLILNEFTQEVNKFNKEMDQINQQTKSRLAKPASVMEKMAFWAVTSIIYSLVDEREMLTVNPTFLKVLFAAIEDIPRLDDTAKREILIKAFKTGLVPLNLTFIEKYHRQYTSEDFDWFELSTWLQVNRVGSRDPYQDKVLGTLLHYNLLNLATFQAQLSRLSMEEQKKIPSICAKYHPDFLSENHAPYYTDELRLFMILSEIEMNDLVKWYMDNQQQEKIERLFAATKLASNSHLMWLIAQKVMSYLYNHIILNTLKALILPIVNLFPIAALQIVLSIVATFIIIPLVFMGILTLPTPLLMVGIAVAGFVAIGVLLTLSLIALSLTISLISDLIKGISHVRNYPEEYQTQNKNFNACMESAGYSENKDKPPSKLHNILCFFAHQPTPGLNTGVEENAIDEVIESQMTQTF